MAYAEYENVRNRLYKAKNSSEVASIIESTKTEYALIEARSFHPYIKFQKARVYILFLINLPRRVQLVDSMRNHVCKIVSEAYYQTYFLVTFGGHSYVANTESYASFLWLYGIHLQQDSQTPEAVNVLEEATTKFSCLKTIRKPGNAAKAHASLAVCYAVTYLKSENDKYLNKIKSSCSEAFRLNRSMSPEEQSALRLLSLFSDVFLKSYRFGEARRVLMDCRPYPNYLRPITSALEEKLK